MTQAEYKIIIIGILIFMQVAIWSKQLYVMNGAKNRISAAILLFEASHQHLYS